MTQTVRRSGFASSGRQCRSGPPSGQTPDLSQDREPFGQPRAGPQVTHVGALGSGDRGGSRPDCAWNTQPKRRRYDPQTQVRRSIRASRGRARAGPPVTISRAVSSLARAPPLPLAGGWLIRRDRRGPASSVAALAFLSLLGLSILAIFAFDAAAGIAVEAVPIVMFGVVTVAAAAQLAVALAGIWLSQQSLPGLTPGSLRSHGDAGEARL